MSRNTIFKTLKRAIHQTSHRSGYFATPVRHMRLFRARDEEETRNFLILPNAIVFTLQKLLNSGKYFRENMFGPKFPAVRPLPMFFKGSK